MRGIVAEVRNLNRVVLLKELLRFELLWFFAVNQDIWRPYMTSGKKYVSDVRTDDGYADIPSKARFTIDTDDAQEIIKLAGVVQEHGLFTVVKFDYRVVYATGKKRESTDADTLNVSASEFWFAAYIKHTNTEILTERFRISDMAKHFNLEQRKEKENTKKTEKAKPRCILQHDIEYSYREWDGEMDESDEEHIEKIIAKGYNQGDLCTADPKSPDEVHYGWWKIVSGCC